MASIHDRLLQGYEVDCGARRLTLRFGSSTGQSDGSVTAVFDGIAGYELGDDALGNIGGEIIPVSTEQFVERYGDQMARSFAKAGAFGEWARALESIHAHLQSEGLQGFEVTSAIGLNGWVLARHLRLDAS